MADWVQLLKQRYAGMKIVVGRDKLDEIQVGLAQWLESMSLIRDFFFHRVSDKRFKRLKFSLTDIQNFSRKLAISLYRTVVEPLIISPAPGGSDSSRPSDNRI